MISKTGKNYETPLGRLYKVDGDFFPSVTSVLKGFKPPGGQPFTTDYMSVGTLGHYECLIKHKPDMEYPDVVFSFMSDEEINRRLDDITLMWNTIKKGKVLDVEFVVYDPINRYAGRGDIIQKKNKRISIGDIKTGQFYKYYEIQLGGYYNAAKDTYKIEEGELYILDSNQDRNPEKKPDVITYFKSELEEFAGKFLEKAAKYNKAFDEYIESWNHAD